MQTFKTHYIFFTHFNILSKQDHEKLTPLLRDLLKDFFLKVASIATALIKSVALTTNDKWYE